MINTMDMDTKKIEEHNDDTKMWAGEDVDEKEVAYYRSIDECAENSSNKFIENSMPSHATYLMIKMLHNAAREVRLFSKNLCMSKDKTNASGNEKVYASQKLIDEAVAFLKDRDGTLNIVLESEIDGGTSHPLIAAIDAIKAQIKGRVVIRKLSSDVEPQDRRHFMVMDNRAYRIEYDHVNTKALANFGDSEKASLWVNYFDKILLEKSNIIYQTA
jgi:hypothetical protein